LETLWQFAKSSRVLDAREKPVASPMSLSILIHAAAIRVIALASTDSKVLIHFDNSTIVLHVAPRKSSYAKVSTGKSYFREESRASLRIPIFACLFKEYFRDRLLGGVTDDP